MNMLGNNHLFQRFGIELEYMIVDRSTLDVRPICDQLMLDVAGEYASEIERGSIAWSNELALHVVELKTNGPATSLWGVADQFQQEVQAINRYLERHQAQLMPTAMHPWMNPMTELTLWPHDYNPVYEAFHRIFDCRGHGWANLQSTHVNLPFDNDHEFGHLHAAIRLILPILPAIAASSPIVERHITGFADNRMEVYRNNSRKIRAVAGDVIPEPAYTEHDYRQQILEPIYQAIAPHDPDGALQYEWLNARGAIARFERQTIEIRVLDVQECPAADIALTAAVVGVLELLVEQRWTDLEEQKQFPSASLHSLLKDVIRDAESTVIKDADFLTQFGYRGRQATAKELWTHLLDAIGGLRWLSENELAPFRTIVRDGTLAQRIRRTLTKHPDELHAIYNELCRCLQDGQMFRGW